MSNELIEEFVHEGWCDTQNKISKVCNCIISGPLDVIEDLRVIIEENRRLNQEIDDFLTEISNIDTGTGDYLEDKARDLLNKLRKGE